MSEEAHRLRVYRERRRSTRAVRGQLAHSHQRRTPMGVHQPTIRRGYNTALTSAVLGVFIAVIHGLAGPGVRPALAQPDTSRGMPPALLRRLAEVIDGDRTGRPIYVVASFTFPHPVL